MTEIVKDLKLTGCEQITLDVRWMRRLLRIR
jgi:hypothetical protein